MMTLLFFSNIMYYTTDKAYIAFILVYFKTEFSIFQSHLAFTHLKTSVQYCSSCYLLFTRGKKNPQTCKKSMTFNSALLICLDNAAIELCLCQW